MIRILVIDSIVESTMYIRDILIDVGCFEIFPNSRINMISFVPFELKDVASPSMYGVCFPLNISKNEIPINTNNIRNLVIPWIKRSLIITGKINNSIIDTDVAFIDDSGVYCSTGTIFNRICADLIITTSYITRTNFKVSEYKYKQNPTSFLMHSFDTSPVSYGNLIANFVRSESHNYYCKFWSIYSENNKCLLM